MSDNTNINKWIYLDSDGVLADFDKLIKSLLGESFDASQNKALLWQTVKQYNDTVAPFFESLEVMPDAQRLVQFCLNLTPNVAILTATGTVPHDAAEQKIKWYKKHWPNLKVITVLKSHNKAEYANATSILVDDRVKSIEPWVQAGGIGILHKTVDDTINQLNNCFKQIGE